jgi:hypothetical protein
MVPAAYRRLLRGPLVGAIGASATLAASGVATVLLPGVASSLWTRERAVLTESQYTAPA